RAALAQGHHARVRQSDDRVGRILGGVAGLLAELIECRLRALQIRLELGRAFVEPMPDRIDEARPGNGIRRRRRGRIGGGLARRLAWDLARGPDLLRGSERDQAKRAHGHTARAMVTKEQASSISGWLVIPVPSTSQPRAGWAGHVAKMRSGGTSEQIEGGD